MARTSAPGTVARGNIIQLKYADHIEQIGEDFDPNAFDCEQANTRLVARFNKKERI